MHDLHKRLTAMLDALDFEVLWPGFKRQDFALYDDESVVMENREIEKTDVFYGNTSIPFEGGRLAIWHVDAATRALPLPRLASLIVHEMFHSHQVEHEETRYGNEMLGLRYPYDKASMMEKHHEGRLLASMLEHGEEETLPLFAGIREHRRQRIPDAVAYDEGIETFEGMATYVEMKALEHLDEQRWVEERDRILDHLSDPGHLMSVRMRNHHGGYALLAFAEHSGIVVKHAVGDEDRSIAAIVLNGVAAADVSIEHVPEVAARAASENERLETSLKRIIGEAASHGEGRFRLVGFDPLNCRYHKGWLINEQYAVLADGHEKKVFRGRSLMRLHDDHTVTEWYHSERGDE